MHHLVALAQGVDELASNRYVREVSWKFSRPASTSGLALNPAATIAAAQYPSRAGHAPIGHRVPVVVAPAREPAVCCAA